MRIIDADALKKQILKRLCIKSMNYLSHAEKAIVECIDDVPTIEPERKKGKWVKEHWFMNSTDYKYTCSECGAHHRAMYDFCPSCGKWMR